MEVSAFVEAFGRWARTQSDIAAVALVGSYARRAATKHSDVDLVILTRSVDKYLRQRSWLSLFGAVTEWREEDYGRLKSVRVFYESGLEVEYGVTTADWAYLPINAGTQRVVSDGMKILYDRQGLLARLQQEAASVSE